MKLSTTQCAQVKELIPSELQHITGGNTIPTITSGATPIATTGNSTLFSDGTIVSNTGWLFLSFR